MSDLISREAVIKALENCYCGGEDSCGEPWIYKDHVIKAVEQLPPAQLGTNLAEVGTDAVSRKAVKELAYSQIRSMYCGVALKEQRETMLRIADNVIGLLAPVASKQSEIIRCKDCQYWNKGSCECPEHVVNSQDYYVGDIETEAEHFCGYADGREVTT